MDFCESDVLSLGSDLEDSNIKKQVLFFLTEGGCIWFGARSANCPVSVQRETGRPRLSLAILLGHCSGCKPRPPRTSVSYLKA